MRIRINVRRGTARPVAPIADEGFLLGVSPAEHFRSSFKDGYVAFKPMTISQLSVLDAKLRASFLLPNDSN